MDEPNIRLAVQRALLGEVPSSLRFIYAHTEDKTLHFHAVFTENAPDKHLECASRASTELIADYPADFSLVENIVRSDRMYWKIGDGSNLHFLRYGEMSEE
jgi:uncharacterized protein (DUF2336 family)